MPRIRVLALIVVALALAACGSTLALPKIDRHPDPLRWGQPTLAAIPTCSPDPLAPLQADLRGQDVSTLDLRPSLDTLLRCTDFDSQTTWPPAERMPAGFDWQQITELGKNPGLGVRSLHARGITGQGVGIAIVDSPILVDHQEYAGRLRLYEEGEVSYRRAQMHGMAVASIAAGQTVGVAPGADLYYINTPMGLGEDYAYLARAIRRFLEINRQLPAERRIRVISISLGWDPTQTGYADIQAAAAEARSAGLLVVCSSIEEVHGFKFHGLGRDPLADPERFESYEPGMWWVDQYYAGMDLTDRLLVPMDSRTTASPTGTADYVFYREGGWSWSIPYIAGIYALAVQVDPAITPERFWALALQTGRTIQLQHEGRTYTLGLILDPVALIEALQ